jgi:hypothetical protein
MNTSRALLLPAAIVLTAALMPGSLDGAVVFTATTKVARPAPRLASLWDSTVRGSIDGNRGRIEFLESGNPATPRGSVILTLDGGRTARLFDPGARACRSWVSSGPASWSNPAVPGESTRYENLEVRKTLEEAGPTIAGRATRHYRFTIAYDTSAGGRRSHTERVEDIWADAGLSDPAFAVWLTAAAPQTGNAEFDRRLSKTMAQVRGTPLKRVTVARVKFEGRPEQTTTTTLEVTELAQKVLAPSTFLDPFACKIPKPEERR